MPATPKWVPSAPALEETPDSGSYELSETGTIFVQKYNGKYADVVAAAIPAGTIGTGDASGFVLKTCTVTKSRGEIGLLTLKWGGWGTDEDLIPGDRFGLRPTDLNPAVEKADAFSAVTEEEHEKIKAAVFTADSEAAIRGRLWVQTYGSTDAQNLLALLIKGVTNYYKPFFEYYWEQSFTSEPAVNTGGYREAPGGPLSSTIAALSLSCLRKADDLSYDGTLYRRVRSWLCATDAYWDSTLYP